jgi:cell wall-associated NlpC family hydrolase
MEILEAGNYPDTCLDYWGALSIGGYGRCSHEGKPLLAHRVALEFKLGQPLGELLACHTCDRPICYNPKHLWPGTHHDNQMDMYAKGRGANNQGSNQGQSKLTDSDVLEILKLRKEGHSQQSIADLFQVTQQNVQAICKGHTWKHIPRNYCHQARLPGVGLDCLGVVLSIASHFNLSDYENNAYSRYGNGVDLVREFEQNLHRTTNPQSGDILVFKFGKHPQHVGILSSIDGQPSLIHAYQTIGVVAEHNFDESWARRVCDSFSFFPQE